MANASPGGLCAPRKLLYYTPHEPVTVRLMSDLHVGAQNVDYKLIRREIEAAVNGGHRVVVNGDVFDAVVAHDKRFSPDVLHPRLAGRRDPLNEAVKWAAELFSGAEHLVDMIGVGNHEESVTKYAGIDINQILIHELRKANTDADHVIHYGGYSGFCEYRFRKAGTAKRATSGNAQCPHRLVIYYHHGSGGAAPVTGGLINFNRKAVWVNADVIWMGHHHSRLCRDTETIGLSLQGRLRRRKQLYIMTGAYFNTYQLQSQESYAKRGRVSNYAADMGVAPQGKGGALLRVTISPDGAGVMRLAVEL